MSNLPAQRITPDIPFLSIGLDFAGPFQLLNRKGRGATSIKCYLCLFICLSYKCIHSKDAFIMTLPRFISRRGKPAEIFCDNDRNFVGAPKEVGKCIKQVKILRVTLLTRKALNSLLHLHMHLTLKEFGNQELNRLNFI